MIRGRTQIIPGIGQKIESVLTVQPFRIVFKCPLEAVLLPPGGEVVQVRAEDDRVSLGELRIRARVQPGKASGIAMLHPDCSTVVRGVVRTLRDAHSNPRNVFIPMEVSEVRLKLIE